MDELATLFIGDNNNVSPFHQNAVNVPDECADAVWNMGNLLGKMVKDVVYNLVMENRTHQHSGDIAIQITCVNNRRPVFHYRYHGMNTKKRQEEQEHFATVRGGNSTSFILDTCNVLSTWKLPSPVPSEHNYVVAILMQASRLFSNTRIKDARVCSDE